MFKVEIKTSSAAFRDYLTGEESDYEEVAEIVRILTEVQKGLEMGLLGGGCYDINGNRVGEWCR